MSEPVVLLHGFAGTGTGWAPVAALLARRGYLPLCPDVRGHGSASDLRPVSFSACVEDVLSVAPRRFVLCGYSMGARLALGVALAAGSRVSRLVLVSATAGIEGKTERSARLAADHSLAAAIEAGSVEEFAARWVSQPLFASDPPSAVALQREDILRNSVSGLAAALRGIGTGAMTPMWDRLGSLTMPTRVLAGERDTKYVALGERLARELPNATLTIVPGAGHGLHREVPDAVAEGVCSIDLE